jgi:transcriptional regulator with XRE-family HTH domain
MAVLATSVLERATLPVDRPTHRGVSLCPMETVGDRVRRYRRQRRLTQDQLAARAGVDRRYLGRIETGEIQQPGVETVAKLAAALKEPIRALADPGWYSDEESTDWLAGLRNDERLDNDGKDLIERLVRRELESAERRESRPSEGPKKRAV